MRTGPDLGLTWPRAPRGLLCLWGLPGPTRLPAQGQREQAHLAPKARLTRRALRPRYPGNVPPRGPLRIPGPLPHPGPGSWGRLPQRKARARHSHCNAAGALSSWDGQSAPPPPQGVTATPPSSRACHQHPICARPPCHQGSRRVGPSRCPRGNRAGRAEAGWGPLYLPQVQGDVDLVVLRAAGQRRALPPALRAVDGIARGVRPVAVGSRADVTVLALWGGGGQRAGPGWAPRLPHLTPPTPDLRTLARQSLLRSANLRRARLGTRHLWEAAAPIMEEASMGNRAPALGANSRARLPEEAAAEGCTIRGRALQVAGRGCCPSKGPGAGGATE